MKHKMDAAATSKDALGHFSENADSGAAGISQFS